MIWDVIYPEKCMVCGKITGSHESGVCSSCRKSFPYIRGGRCSRCSKKISGNDSICSDCMKHRHVYSQGYALFAYDGVTDKIMADIKYSGKKRRLDWLAKELVYHSSMYMKRWKPQLVVPVPLYYAKRRKRGFNQAEIIAVRLADEYGIACDGNLLIRKRNTKAQKNLGGRERKENLKGAFCVSRSRLGMYPALKSVVIVDDIYTTGSTIDACASELIKEGIENVYFISLCVGNGYSYTG